MHIVVSGGERSKADGRQWRNASDAEKKKYEDMAAERKEKGDTDLDENQRQRRVRGLFDATKEHVMSK